MIRLDKIGKQNGRQIVFIEASAALQKGEKAGLVGPNGAGKTTLFGLVSGFLPPSGGDVRFKGRSIVGLPPDRVARLGLSRSFQIVQVFAAMSVIDVVTTAALLRHPMREAIKRATAVLERVGLRDKAEETPASLSLQDKKLLELAKCLATEPEMILLDEVMAGLTLGEAQVPLAIIRDLRASGMTFVMVEHVMPVIMNTADRLVVLNFGEQVAAGTPDEIVADERVREAYFGDDSHA